MDQILVLFVGQNVPVKISTLFYTLTNHIVSSKQHHRVLKSRSHVFESGQSLLVLSLRNCPAKLTVQTNSVNFNSVRSLEPVRLEESMFAKDCIVKYTTNHDAGQFCYLQQKVVHFFHFIQNLICFRYELWNEQMVSIWLLRQNWHKRR